MTKIQQTTRDAGIARRSRSTSNREVWRPTDEERAEHIARHAQALAEHAARRVELLTAEEVQDNGIR